MSLLSKFRNSKMADQTEYQKASTKKFESFKDPRFWEFRLDPKTKTAEAIIRFLPNKNFDDLPVVPVKEHNFEGPNGWFKHNCLKTIHKPCPVCEAIKPLWGTNGSEKPDDNDPNVRIARNRKARDSYIANIYVCEDPANPENEGKVFLFKFGKQIKDLIDLKTDASKITESQARRGVKPVLVYHPLEGADFMIRGHMNDKYPAYTKSEFLAPSPAIRMKNSDEPDEAAIEAMLNQLYDLGEFTDPDGLDRNGKPRFLSYEQLRAEYVAKTGDDIDADAVSKPRTNSSKKVTAKDADDEEAVEQVDKKAILSRPSISRKQPEPEPEPEVTNEQREAAEALEDSGNDGEPTPAPEPEPEQKEQTEDPKPKVRLSKLLGKLK